KGAIDEIIVEPYTYYVDKFNEAAEKLLEIAPSVDAVDDLYTEDDKLKFILAFRTLMRLHKKMSHYTEFTWDDLQMAEQCFADYTSKYLDIKDGINHNGEKDKTSILNDIDFELELIRRDTINVSYIIQLLVRFKSKDNPKDRENVQKEINILLNNEVSLRSKRELIEKFIQTNLPFISDSDAIPDEFEKFWNKEQERAFKELVKEENLSENKTEKLVEHYLFAEREPLRDEILDLIDGEKPSILHRKNTGDRIMNKILNFIDTFVNGITGDQG